MFNDFAPSLKAAATAASLKKTTVVVPGGSRTPAVYCRCCGKSGVALGRIHHADRCLFRQL